MFLLESRPVAPATAMSAPAASSLPATSSDVERGGDSSRPPVPNIEVRFEDLRWSIPITAQEQRKGIPTVLGAVARTFTKLPLAIAARLSHTARAAQAAPPPFVVLDGVSGVLRPGTLTLLLSPPGHGKSALLKALTQLLPSKELGGTVTYSGLTPAAARAAHVHLGSLCQYVSQLDEHLCVRLLRARECVTGPGAQRFPLHPHAGYSSLCVRRSSSCRPTRRWTLAPLAFQRCTRSTRAA